MDLNPRKRPEEDGRPGFPLVTVRNVVSVDGERSVRASIPGFPNRIHSSRVVSLPSSVLEEPGTPASVPVRDVVGVLLVPRRRKSSDTGDLRGTESTLSPQR